jgi:hypothetical protein
MRSGLSQFRTSRSINPDFMATPAEFARYHTKRHRHAIDFGRESFGDEGELHGKVWAGVIG